MEKISQQDKASLWHDREAHVSNEKLKKISSNNIVNGLSNFGSFLHEVVCEGCHYGKTHCFPFEKTLIRSIKPLKLIHSNFLT